MENVPANGNRGVVSSRIHLKPDTLSRLREGISFLLSRWDGLQMAIQNEWGGQDSLHKSHLLAADILCWLSQSKAPLCIEDLENLLHESMLLSFNTEIEDGSIEEVAEQLMIMHEEYLQGIH